MEKSAIFHRPDSEYAYPLDDNKIQLRIRTKKDDAKRVSVIWGDPYDAIDNVWQHRESPMKLMYQTELFDYWYVDLQLINRRIQYAFKLSGSDEDLFFDERNVVPCTNQATQSGHYFKMPYLHKSEQVPMVSWASETVWYQIFPERFANGDTKNDPENVREWNSQIKPSRSDFFGGDLQGIIDHLEYLKELGISGLYLCPIFEAPSNHKYDTTDYYKVDPHFGDGETLKNLISTAHSMGMKVMLDAVFNHIGSGSAQWQDVETNGSESKYFDWFHVNQNDLADTNGTPLFEVGQPEPYDTFAYAKYMPKLNTNNPEVKKYLLDIAQFWIKNFDIDAWRLDVANEVDHAFWKSFAKACHRIKPDFYILGEVWNLAQPWLQGDEFSASMNYPFTDIAKDAFIAHEITGEEMIDQLNQELTNHKDPVNLQMLNVLDSHDTSRLLHQCDENKDLMKQVMTFMFLQRGMPCVYYGDEIGLTGGDDPDNRRCMEWSPSAQDKDLLGFFQELISFRKENGKSIETGINESVDENIVEVKINSNFSAYFNLGTQNFDIETAKVPTLSQNYDANTGVLKPTGYVVIERKAK